MTRYITIEDIKLIEKSLGREHGLKYDSGGSAIRYLSDNIQSHPEIIEALKANKNSLPKIPLSPSGKKFFEAIKELDQSRKKEARQSGIILLLSGLILWFIIARL